MKHYALLGAPIGDSLSPQLHHAGFVASGVDAEYRLWPTTLAEVDARLVDATAQLKGFNITQPLKRAVLPYLKTITARARTVGAVNTVRVDGGLLHGDNTDIVGFERSVQALAPQRGAALVLGSGGVVGAVLHVLAAAGFAPLVVAARRKAPVDGWSEHLGLPLVYRPWAARHGVDPSVTLIIQATPLGAGERALSVMDLAAWRHGPTVVDLVVKPGGQTPLVQQAQAMGLRALDGRLMLVEQAIAAQVFWVLGDQGAAAMRRVLDV